MCDRYSCILPYFKQIYAQTAAKTLKYPFLTLVLTIQNFKFHHNAIAMHVFANRNANEMIILGCKAFPCSIMQTNQGSFLRLTS